MKVKTAHFKEKIRKEIADKMSKGSEKKSVKK